MQQRTFEKLLYTGALLPLTLGSVIFFYWFLERTFYAVDVRIELPAFCAMLGYVLLGFLTLLLCVVYAFKFKDHWTRTLTVLLLVVLTIPVIALYGTIYDLNESITYLRLTNDAKGYRVQRIWSTNFEITNLESRGSSFVVAYQPVYIYDWTKKDSFGYVYEINDVFIDLVRADYTIITYHLPELNKGVCERLKVSEIMQNSLQRPGSN